MLIASCKKQTCMEEICDTVYLPNSLIDSLQDSIIHLIEDVSTSDYYVYNAKDNYENTMECAKIIAYQNDTFIAVYHTVKNNIFSVKVAISTNLQSWYFKKTLATNASQPTIYKIENNSFYLAWEQEPSNHILLSYYNNLSDLIHNLPYLQKELTHTLSSKAEGTPNIYSVSDSSIKIGFHYYCKGDVDREATGILQNLQSWSTQKEPCLDRSLSNYSINGNIGDRDNLNLFGHDFLAIEAQGKKGDFGTWKCYLYSPETNVSKWIPFKTHKGSSNFANPTISILTLHQRTLVLVTAYIHRDRAMPNEQGCLLFYKFL